MGACAGKKSKKSSITPTVSTEGGGIETEVNSQQRESEELAALRKIYLASEGRMNRRIKNCYECAFGKESDHVTDLNLKFVNLGPEGMLQLSSVLPFYPNLSSLRLWKTRFGNEGAAHLGKGLLHLPNLRLLSLEDNEIGAEGLSRFAEGLKSLLNLEELYIHSNRLGPDGGMILSTIVGSYRRLRSLTADENGLEDQAAEVIIRGLLRSAHTLRLIGMSFNKLTDHTASFLLRHVRDFTELKRVALNGNHVSEDLRDSLMTDGPQVAFDF